MFTIYESEVGSRLHGTNIEGTDDHDYMGVYLETKERFIGFSQQDTIVQRTKPYGVRSEVGDVDRTLYGLKKFLNLALKGNPSILILLYSPHAEAEIRSPVWVDLVDTLLPNIISKQCYMPFRGYMKQQMERLMGMRGQKNVTRPELVEKYGFDTKYAGHIVRLAIQGIELLSDGMIYLPMQQEKRQLILDIRQGKYKLVELYSMFQKYEEALELAMVKTWLPPSPNKRIVEDWMIEQYLTWWGSKYEKQGRIRPITG